MKAKLSSAAAPCPPKRHWWIGIVAVLIVVSVCLLALLNQRPEQSSKISQPLPTQPAQGPIAPAKTVIKMADGTIVAATEPEMTQLVNSLLKAINPANAENSYMPPFLRDKINWGYSEIAQKRIEVMLRPWFSQKFDGTQDQATMMDSGYYSVNNDHKAPFMGNLNIFAPRLLTYVRVQQKVPVGFNQMSKNTFSIMFAHEMVHLERSPQYFVGPYRPEGRKKEEVRTWFKVSMEIVRPLRKVGQPLESDFLECDDILKGCYDDPTCPAFLDFVITGTKGTASHFTK